MIKTIKIRALLEAECPLYRSNEKLCQAVGSNEFLLYFGFKRLFRISPHDYYLDLRLMIGKELLWQGHTVLSVAIALEYKDVTRFINQLKEKFGYTPGKWRKGVKQPFVRVLADARTPHFKRDCLSG